MYFDSAKSLQKYSYTTNMKEKSKVQVKNVLNKRMTQRNDCYYANLTLVIQWRFIEKKKFLQGETENEFTIIFLLFLLSLKNQ